MKKEEIKTEKDVIRALRGKTNFEIRVLVETFRIPRGKVSTYKRIAEKIGRPCSFRAVGNALHKNPLAPVVPCHRVVGSNGALIGFADGIGVKMRMLKEEGIPFVKSKVKFKREILY